MADLVNTTLTWLQSGEPVTGGSGGSSGGVLNRPLVELLANDSGLNTRINTLSDDDGYVKKVISSVKITETDAATTARVQIDATGLKGYDGTNIVFSVNESGGVTLGYGANDQISLSAGVLTGNFNSIVLGDASGIGIDVTEAAQYALRLGNCTTGGYGPFHIINAGVSGAANLHTTYPNAAIDTWAVDSNHDPYIKTGSSTWTKIGASAASEGPVSSAAITSSLSTDNAVILDQDGLTMRKGAGAVRFDVNEDGSFTLGYASGANLAFTTGDAMTLTSATLTSCSIAGEEINSGTVAAARIADLSGTYAVVALGVTNGNSHDHSGGDGAQISHTALSSIGTNTHAQIDTFISGHTHDPSEWTSGWTDDGVYVVFRGDNSSPSELRIAGPSTYYTKFYTNDAGTPTYVMPNVTDSVDLTIGTSSVKHQNISIYANTALLLDSDSTITLDSNSTMTLTSGATLDINAVTFDFDASGEIAISAGANNGLQLYAGTDSDGNNHANIWINPSDNGHIVYRIRVNTDTENYYMTESEFYTASTQVVDLGLTGNRWNTVFCYDVDNIADYIWMDDRKKGKKTVQLNDLEILNSIKPSDKIDPRTGCKFIDDDTIPEILLSRHKKTNEILRDSEGKPGFSMRVLNSLFMGAFRQVDSMCKDFDSRLKVLEEFAEVCKDFYERLTSLERLAGNN